MGLHSLSCGAPICSEDEGDYVWYAGEPICPKGRTKIQINQRKINKLILKGAFRNVDAFFTARELAQLQRITGALKSRIPPKMSNKHRESPYYPHTAALPL